jgi:lipid-binding SYLF domain-containing protein
MTPRTLLFTDLLRRIQVRKLGRKAAGVLVFPSVVKAGMLLGGQYGEGVLIVRGNAAGYYNIISASLGFQLGVQSLSIIIVCD